MSDGNDRRGLNTAAIEWALYETPEDIPPALILTLLVVASFTDYNDGRGAYPSVDTVARLTRKSHRQVQRDLDELEKRGLLLPGDPDRTQKLRSNRRPNVYDLPDTGRKYVGRHRKRGDIHVTPSGVTPMTPQALSGVTPMTPQALSGVTPMTVWGDTHDRFGVTPMTPNHLSDHKNDHLSPPAREAQMLAAAVPAATEREIEDVLKNLETRRARGEIRNVRAYLKTVIGNGDAAALVDEVRGSRGQCHDFKSGDCKGGDHDVCQHSRCTCGCHTKPAEQETR